MARRSLLPAALAVLAGFFSCTVLGKYSTHNKQMLFRSNFHVETTVCRTAPGLKKSQMDLCHRHPDTVAVALEGLQQAVKECQHQFQEDRWNCSSLSSRAMKPYASAIYQKGFKETAFVHAISSAGVVISVARACGQGSLKNCGCDTHKYKMKGAPAQRSSWKWTGCSHNLHYGIKFSKMFLDSRESGDDLHSQISLHNNNVGRTTVAANMQVKCTCHGLSGSCEMKTCWRSIPDFRVVAAALKKKYRESVLVQASNKNLQVSKPDQTKKKQRVRLKQWTPQKPRRKRGLKNELLYYERGPDFCEENPVLDVWGTAGRTCNCTHTKHGSCEILCCGRGYNLVKQKWTETCNCRFHWCCKVECQNCTVERWISTCK